MQSSHKDGLSLVWDENGRYREQTWMQLKERITMTQGGIGTAADDFIEMLRYRGAPFRDQTWDLREAFSELVADATTDDDLKLLARILSVMMLEPFKTNPDAGWFIQGLRETGNDEFDADRAAQVLNYLYLLHPTAARILYATLSMFVDRHGGTVTLWDRIYNTGKLHPEFFERVYVATEGKSDWKHLEAALRWFQNSGKFRKIKVEFMEECDWSRQGSRPLLAFCEQHSKIPSPTPIVAVFDRDEPDIIKQVQGNESYKGWGNNVFSMVLPVPPHRESTPDLSIEFYYVDSDLKRVDAKGRRLFLSSEFIPKSGRQKDGILNCTTLNKLGRLAIIDDNVFNTASVNVALTKDDFATNILDEAPGFTDIDFSSFALVFKIVTEIAEKSDRMLQV